MQILEVNKYTPWTDNADSGCKYIYSLTDNADSRFWMQMTDNADSGCKYKYSLTDNADSGCKCTYSLTDAVSGCKYI